MADGCREVTALISHYTQDWWQLDATHLEILTACTGTTGLERIRQIADLAIFEYVNAASDAFSEVVERGEQWPPSARSRLTRSVLCYGR